MGPEGSLPWSQDTLTDPYPEPDEYNPTSKPYFPKIHFHNILPPPN
jgi:hypothetical protein